MSSADQSVISAMFSCLDLAGSGRKSAGYVQVEGQSLNHGLTGTTFVAMPNWVWAHVKKLLTQHEVQVKKLAGPTEDRL